MKTICYLAAALSLPLAITACDSGHRYAPGTHVKEIVYTGTLPAADVSGIHYTLHLDYDDDHNYTDGDYRMYETYVNADTAALSGSRDLRTIRSEGDFTVEKGIVADNNLPYIKLVPDVRDSGPGVSAQPVYFAITSDSTLVMLGADMSMPGRPQDYTLVSR